MNAVIDGPDTKTYKGPLTVVSKLTPQTPSVTPVDKGAQAANVIRAKGLAYKAKRAVVKLIWLCLLITLVCIGAVGYYGYKMRVVGVNTDTRSCTWPVGGLTITGTRSYTYGFQEYFGFRITDTAQITEKTIMNLDGTAMTVVGSTGDKWWAEVVRDGDRGQLIMKPATNYLFVSGKNIGMVEYKSFCK
jgi:hypothetical protein